MDELNLKDFIVVIDNFMPEGLCKKVIDTFEQNEKYHEVYDYNKAPSFTQLNFTQHAKNIDSQLHQQLTLYMIEAVKSYGKNVPEVAFWKPGFSYEQLRIKKYKNNNYDQFDLHTDSCSIETSKRFLAFFWYLNDVAEGGETEFVNVGVKVKPQTGKLVMFPPNWMYPHKGLVPVSNEKYLLSSYLHFS